MTKEGPSGEGKETVIKTNVVMDSEAMSGLRDPSVLSWLLRAWSMVIMPMRCDFNGKKASADSEERSVSASGGATAGRGRAFALPEMPPPCLPPWQSKR